MQAKEGPMSDQFDKFIDGLTEDDGDVERMLSTKVKAPHEFSPRKFRCESCGGSGLWQGGRVNQHGNQKCWTCHGHGFLVTSAADRQKARASSAASKEKSRQSAQDENAAHGGGALLKFLEENASWNDFCRSLLTQHANGKAFSEAQVAAARRMWVKIEEQRRARAQEREAAKASAPKADGARIRQMFDAALAAGKKQRALHAGNFDPEGQLLNKVVLTPARPPRTEIWVRVDDEFFGSIKVDGMIDLRRNAPEWLASALQRIAADPDGECRLYGRRTGICACCGRTLTNGISIELGIGPICRQKWGLA
jgi:hypothetical protein